MSTNLNPAAKCFIGYIENNPVCFFAVLHFPHPKVKNFKRGHRLVVLPDYQGLGIGHIFSSAIAQDFIDNGFRFIITSSTKSLYNQRARDKARMQRLYRAGKKIPQVLFRRIFGGK